MFETAALLLLPRLRVQNANAVSGPLSWGFPAPTAFTGFAHALERRLRELSGSDLRFGGVGIVCHRFEPQVFQPPGRRNQVFRLTRNPVGRDGATSALVEEGRTHMEVSLLIEVLTEPEELPAGLDRLAAEQIQTMRLAGGSILPDHGELRRQPELIEWPEFEDDALAEFRKLRRRLLPGFALVQREDLLADHLVDMRRETPTADALDALLDLCRLNIEPAGTDPKRPEQGLWEFRSKPGWLTPVPVGYAALSPLHGPGEVANARGNEIPFRFVESLYSLGQWLSPHRLVDVEQLLWRHQTDLHAGLYHCSNQYP